MAKNQAGETANNGNDSARAPHDETGRDPLEDEKAGKKESKKPPVPLNLTRFLQERPQSGGIRALLNAKYRAEVKTMEEWENALAGLLNKKTK
jgi:hypothetical protein